MMFRRDLSQHRLSRRDPGHQARIKHLTRTIPMGEHPDDRPQPDKTIRTSEECSVVDIVATPLERQVTA
jgi:hypothetical protein